MVCKALALVVTAALLLGAGSAALAYSNVALNQPVDLEGTFGSDPSLAPTVDNGVFLGEGTQWQTGTVWWSGAATQPQGQVKIDLGMDYSIDKFILQADNNDSYAIYAYNGATPVFTANFGPYGGGGMRTRPEYNLSTPIVCDNLVLQATSGDTSYSVSEIQAWGDPVPVPGSLVLLGSGMMGLGFLRRKLGLKR